MAVGQKLGWNVYSRLLGVVTTVAASKLAAKGWDIVTGEEPPAINDPDSSTKKSLLWLLISGLGVATVQLFVNRFVARRWKIETGKDAPTFRTVWIRL